MATNKSIDNNMPVQSLVQHLNGADLTALAGDIVALFTTRQNALALDVQNKLQQYATKEAADIATLNTLVAKAEAAAEILEGKELDQLSAILENFFNSGAVSGLLDSLHISVGSNNYTLASVVTALAGAANVSKWNFSRNTDGTFACVAQFDNGTNSAFAVTLGEANQSGERDAAFATQDLAGSGVAATFTAKVKNTGGTIDAGNGDTITVRNYAVTEQTNILVSLSDKFTAYTKAADPVPAAIAAGN